MLLYLPHGVHVRSQGRQHLRDARSGKVHFLEHGCDSIHPSQLVETGYEEQECLVGVTAQKVGELLDVESGCGSHLVGLGKERGQYVLHGCRSLLHVHLVLVKYRPEGEELRLCQSGLFPYPGKTGRKLHEITFTRGGGLRQLVNHAGSTEHRLLESHPVGVTEHLSEFSNLLDRSLS